jgi:hypothetical protein
MSIILLFDAIQSELLAASLNKPQTTTLREPKVRVPFCNEYYVTGDMWGQSWSNILDITIPYPGKNFLDVTTEMVEQVR